MANRVTLNVSLTPELSHFVTNRVDSGRYLSSSEVVREGLRLLERRDLAREAAIERLNEKIQAGLDSLDRGEELSGDEVFEGILKKIEAHAAK